MTDFDFFFFLFWLQSLRLPGVLQVQQRARLPGEEARAAGVRRLQHARRHVRGGAPARAARCRRRLRYWRDHRV